MRRVASIALAVAIAVVVIAAVVDALRHGDGEARSPPAQGIPNRRELSGRLRSLGIAGRLFYTDPRCRLRVLVLPDLAAGRPPEGEGVGCAFSLSPGGARVASFAARWDRKGRLIARCRREVVDFVTKEGSRPHGSVEGCAPAWRPGGAVRVAGEEGIVQGSGSLTLARDGDVLQVTGCGIHDLPPCELVLLSRADLMRAARRHPNVAAASEVFVDVTDALWLTRSRIVLLLTATSAFGPPPEQLVAIFERRRLVATRARFDRRVTRLEAQGQLVVAEPAEVFRSDGETVHLPPLTAVHALAASPDGRWVAAASRGAVHLVRTAPRPGVRVVDLPIAARDVAWR